MTSTAANTVPPKNLETAEFETAQVTPVIAGHYVLDLYPSSVAPLLPVLIEKLSLSLTQAGLLTSFTQLPGLLNPLFGMLADRVSVRYFIILAPALTATMLGMIGFAPNYLSLALLLLLAGVGVAAYHATAPALIGHLSGRKIGLGMSLFMAAGEASYATGPLLAVWVVSVWTLDGFWRMVFLGWGVSLMLWWVMRGVSVNMGKAGDLRAILPAFPSLYLPIAAYTVLRAPLNEGVSTYLPTFMKARGASLVLAGASLSILMASAAVGVLLIGPLSDRFSRRRALITVVTVSALLALVFLRVQGWFALVILGLLGLFTLSTNPVLMAMTQERFPANRAMANGTFMMLNFALRPLGTVTFGFLGDRFGMETALLFAALISLLSILPVLKLPK